MAIPEGRMATTVEESTYVVPDGRKFYRFINYELGPIGIEDTSEGLLYQVWGFTWDSGTGNITAVGETSGDNVVVHNIANMSLFTVTFDQNGRVNMAYMSQGVPYLWWYDTLTAQTETLDLSTIYGSGIESVSLYLDDKRAIEDEKSDMLLWFTLETATPGLYDLHMAEQRDRFQTSTIMLSDIETPYIQNAGMNSNLRGQLVLSSAPSRQGV
jgi:hypothetical protein